MAYNFSIGSYVSLWLSLGQKPILSRHTCFLTSSKNACFTFCACFKTYCFHKTSFNCLPFRFLTRLNLDCRVILILIRSSPWLMACVLLLQNHYFQTVEDWGSPSLRFVRDKFYSDETSYSWRGVSRKSWILTNDWLIAQRNTGKNHLRNE